MIFLDVSAVLRRRTEGANLLGYTVKKMSLLHYLVIAICQLTKHSRNKLPQLCLPKKANKLFTLSTGIRSLRSIVTSFQVTSFHLTVTSFQKIVSSFHK